MYRHSRKYRLSVQAIPAAVALLCLGLLWLICRDEAGAGLSATPAPQSPEALAPSVSLPHPAAAEPLATVPVTD